MDERRSVGIEEDTRSGPSSLVAAWGSSTSPIRRSPSARSRSSSCRPTSRPIPAFRERFVHESNAAASTEHPNIVPVYGAGEADGQLYLAMRYIEGTDLGSLLEREGALAPERAIRICAEIADALEAAHDRGLIHRDVKPGNILLDRANAPT